MSFKKNILFILSLIFLFSFTPRVFALNGNFDSVLMCSTNLGCNTSSTMPYSYSYSDSARINFSSINLVQGKTYNINFYMNITSPTFAFSNGYPQLFVIDANNNATRAYPDRGESLVVNNTGGNTYSVNWTFELDNIGGNYVSAYVIFTFSASYNQNIISSTINSSNFLYFDSDDPSGNQDIINNNNNNTQNIINNNNTNTQEIINNQNENTDKQIESQKVCSFISADDIYYSKKMLNSSGALVDNNNFGVSSYISINRSSIIVAKGLSGVTGGHLCFYDSNHVNISCINESNLVNEQSIPIPDDVSFVRFTIRTTDDSPNFYVCVNGNQAISDQMQDINNTLNDDSDPNTSGFLQDIYNFYSNSTPVTDLLTLPLTLLNAYVDNMNATCVAYNLGSLYGTDIIFPCINLEQRLGSSLWGTIDSLFCIFMVYNIAMLCVSIYEGITDLEDSMRGLYTPKHAYTGYEPKHGE